MVNITLIGTSHIAKESIDLIKKEISSQKPEVVAVELDRKRLYSLLHESGKKKIGSIRKLGIMGALFTFIGKIIQEKLGKAVGIAPGTDMKTAVKYGEKEGSKICLIDKDISIIAREMSVHLNFLDKLKFIGYILSGLVYAPFASVIKPKKKIDISKVPPEEVIEKAVSEVKKKFPKLYNILIERRNKHMASVINFLRKEYPEGKIIAVLGAGHVKGIKDILNNKYSIEVEVK